MKPKYEEMQSTLLLCPGAKLYYRKWSVGEDEGFGQVLDVSDRPLQFLMYDCALQEELTLRDVFDFIDANIKSLEPILGNWVCEFVEESKKPFEPDDDDDMKQLELYWHIDCEPEFGTGGMLMPSFHGISHSGEPYGLDFSAANRLAHLPVVLQPNATVFLYPENDGDQTSKLELKGVHYSLIGILYGIIWELSFFGPPKARDAEVAHLKELVKEATEHPERLIPLDAILGAEE